MAYLTYVDQYILSQDEEWKQRILQATVSTAFNLIQEDHSEHDYSEALKRQSLARDVIASPNRHVERISHILASQVPDTLVTTDGSVVTENDVTDQQLGGFVTSNWSTLAGVVSSLPDQE